MPKFEIKHRYSQLVLFECEAETHKEAVVNAVKGGASLGGADLGGADLRGADLGGAYLRGAYLGGADLGGAYLRGADLRGAYLRGAYLGGADLGGADLRGANVNWTSHDIVGELLRRAAEMDVDKLKVAGLILIQRTWCWTDFLRTRDPLTDWALDALAEYVQEGDDAPSVLSKRRAEQDAAKASPPQPEAQEAVL